MCTGSMAVVAVLMANEWECQEPSSGLCDARDCGLQPLYIRH